MKHWLKVLFGVFLVFGFLYSIVYAYIVFQGKDIVIETLQGLTKRKVTVGYVELVPPLNLEISNLNIEGLAKVETIKLAPSIPFLFIGKLAFNNIKIVRPDFTFERIGEKPQEEAVVSSPAPAAAILPLVAAPVETGKKSPWSFAIKRLRIKEGKINFIDRIVKPEGLKITVEDIYLNLDNYYPFPFSAITDFAVEGRIPWEKGEVAGKIEADGWMNSHKKDMQATIKISDIDGVYLSPYLSTWIDVEKARIEKAKLIFTSNLQAHNNNLAAECHLELTDIVRRPLKAEESEEKAAKITDTLLGMFKSMDQGNIVLDFTIRTKMDRPEFGFGTVRAALEDKIAQGRNNAAIKTDDVLMVPSKLVEGMFKGALSLTKSVVLGTINAGLEVGKSVEGIFKKETLPQKK